MSSENVDEFGDDDGWTVGSGMDVFEVDSEFGGIDATILVGSSYFESNRYRVKLLMLLRLWLRCGRGRCCGVVVGKAVAVGEFLIPVLPFWVPQTSHCHLEINDVTDLG